MQNVMVATDGSAGAGRAIDVAAQLAKAANAALSIVTVGRALSAEEQRQYRQFARIEGDSADAAQALAQQILFEAENRARTAGIAPAKTILVWGDPAHTLIETIAHDKPDAIVVGRRGHGPLASLLLGSVSQKLASLAPCVVIVAP